MFDQKHWGPYLWTFSLIVVEKEILSVFTRRCVVLNLNAVILSEEQNIRFFYADFIQQLWFFVNKTIK